MRVSDNLFAATLVSRNDSISRPSATSPYMDGRLPFTKAQFPFRSPHGAAGDLRIESLLIVSFSAGSAPLTTYFLRQWRVRMQRQTSAAEIADPAMIQIST